VTISSGGVLPKIHTELLQRKRNGKFVTTPASPRPIVSASSASKGRKKSAATKFTAKWKTAAKGSHKVNMF